MIALGALLLLAAQAPEPPVPSETQQVAALAFAPPLDRPLTYRVATRRLSRDGGFTSFALVYDLRWQRVGRGYQLLARIDRVESDAHPEVVRALRLMIDPLIGETLTYFVPADGSSVDMVDPDGLWRRVVDRAQALAESSDRPEAKQAAQIIAALPPGERDKLASADIRALVVPANGAIPSGADGPIMTVSVAGRRTISASEPPAAGAAQPIEVDTRWTIDLATGLLAEERRQSFLTTGNAADRKLVEERIRALEPGDPD